MGGEFEGVPPPSSDYTLYTAIRFHPLMGWLKRKWSPNEASDHQKFASTPLIDSVLRVVLGRLDTHLDGENARLPHILFRSPGPTFDNLFLH